MKLEEDKLIAQMEYARLEIYNYISHVLTTNSSILHAGIIYPTKAISIKLDSFRVGIIKHFHINIKT